MSLYANLFRFRERQNHRPLENFLTEALADLLNRMPKDAVVEFVSDLLLSGDNLSCKAWLTYIHTKERLNWITQKSVGSGRLDLLLEADGIATLIVENKIGAKVSEQETHDDTDEPVTDATECDSEEPESFNNNQLMVYGTWLRGQRSNETWGGALVLLTLRTPPPTNFGRGDVKYGVRCQTVCNWRQLWQWLNRNKTMDSGRSSGDKDKEAWRIFCKELAAFLEENDMNESMLTQRDIAAMEISLPTWRIMEDLLNRCTAAAKEQLSNNDLKTKTKRAEPEIVGENMEYRDWVYLRPPSAPVGMYVMWGVHFPEASTWPKTIQPYPYRPHVFVWIGRDGDVPLPDKLLSSIPRPDKPDEWHVTRDGEESVIFATRPLHEFPTKVGEVNEKGIEIEEIVDWVRGRVRELAPMVKDTCKDSI